MQTPRQTAAQWHSGQFSPLYAFASSGVVLPDIEAEIKSCWFDSAATAADRCDLARLWVAVARPIRLNNIEESQVFWSRHHLNAGNSPLQVRRNGKLKTWKTRPGRFSLPIKYGLKVGAYITEETAPEWCHSIE